jgi:hypothetical protein
MILKGPISDAKRIALTVRPPLTSVSFVFFFFFFFLVFAILAGSKSVQKDGYLLAYSDATYLTS